MRQTPNELCYACYSGNFVGVLELLGEKRIFPDLADEVASFFLSEFDNMITLL